MALVSVCVLLKSSCTPVGPFLPVTQGFMENPREEAVAREGTSDTGSFALRAALEPEGTTFPRL